MRLLALLLGASLATGLGAQSSADSALMIYGTGGLNTYDQDFSEAFLDALGPTLSARIVPEVINLHLASEQQRALYAESLRIKHSATNLPVVVTLFADTYDFVKEHGNIFVPGATHIHVLPGADYTPDIYPAQGEQREFVVPSIIQTAVRETGELIASIYPRLDQLYVLSGAGFTDRSYLDQYRSALSAADLPYAIEYLVGVPLPELQEKIGALPENSVILMATYDVDRNGIPSTTRAVTQALSGQHEIPIFGNTSVLVNAGSVGGSITPTASYAQAAATLVRGALTGESGIEPVLPQTRFKFNGAMLDRFDINRSLLPPESEIVNDLPNLWRDYGNWIILGLTVIAAQLILISLLLLAVRRRRTAEEQLVVANKREALGSLAGGIAHDFNNILMAMMANAELASLDADDPKKVKSRLRQLLLAGNRAKGLVAQILMFSRGASTHQTEAVDVVQLLAESTEQVHSLMTGSRSVSCHHATDEAWVRADPNQLHQAIMNICINAKHAMDDGDNLDLKVQFQQIDSPRQLHNQVLPPGSYVTIAISDTGRGIASGHLPHIFEPFYTTKPSGKGTGLGLALVYRIIKGHDGFIDVESTMQQGTTFTLYLPSVSAPAEKVQPELQHQVPRGHGEHILLVDDDQMVLDTNRSCLQKLGYRVTAFTNALDAFHAFQVNPEDYDLLYTDLSMPQMDGARLATRIRQLRSEIGVVINTGYLDSVDDIDIENLRLLSKPADINQIAVAVADSLQAAGTQ